MNFTFIKLPLNRSIFSWLLIAFLILFIISDSIAQQCGFEGQNAFVIDAHLSNEKELIKGLKIYLVNENNEPYVTKTKVLNAKKTRYETQFDTIIFWGNTKAKSLKKQEGPYHRFYLKGAGNTYIVSLPEYEDYKEKGTFMPVYRAWIEDVDGKKNGGDFGIRVVSLNYAHSVSICGSGIMHNEPNIHHNPPQIKRMDGGYFMPMDVNMSYRPSLIADTGLVKHMYRTKRDTLFNSNGNDSLFGIKEIEIKNYRTLIPVQKIVMPQILWVGNIMIENVVEYHDFFGDNPRDVKDFRILVSNTRGIDGQFHKRYLNFVYNEDANHYDSDKAMDNYADVEINKSTGAITRTEFLTDTYGKTKITYRYTKNKWDLLSIEKPKKPEQNQTFVPTPPKPSFSCITWIDEPKKTKVIHASELYYITLKDTFRFINSCDQSLHLASLIVGHNSDFSYSPSVGAFDTGYVYYQKLLTINPNRIIFHESAIKPDSYNTLNLNYIIVGKNARITKTGDEAKKYCVFAGTDSIFLEVLTVNQMSQPITFGTMAIDDTTRYGNWKLWDSTGNETYKTYSRKVIYSVKIFNGQTLEAVNFKVKKEGAWINLKSWLILDSRHVYISEGMDSLKLYNKMGQNGLKINYKTLADQNYQQIYLIARNQYSISINGFQVPVELIPNLYRVQPDWVGMQKLNNGKYGQEHFLEYFKFKYPRLVSSIQLLYESEVIIDLNRVSDSEKKYRLETLENDEMIQSISQLIELPGSRITFCDRIGTLIMNYNLSYDSVKTIINSFDFKYHGPISGTGNYYQFSYNQKLIDRHFFDIYNKACALPDVISGSLSFYFKAEVDNTKD